MNKDLIVLLAGPPVGHVRRDSHDRMTFTYEENWRTRRGAYPLSLSIPLASSERPHEKIDAFLLTMP